MKVTAHEESAVMRLCVIGTGYVGLVTGTCFAEMGHRVSCVDVDAAKVARLKAGEPTIYEPGLKELMQNNMRERRLFFTTDLADGLKEAEVCFIAVGTPSTTEGAADISMVLAVADSIGKCIDQYMVVVNKSTVPVGTADKVRAVIQARLQERGLVNVEFDIVSNPEFLKEGAAVEDFMRPERVVVGSDNPRAAERMRELYEPFVRNQNPILLMDIKSAEITKYAANAMLALRISFMNEMAALCEQAGADIAQVRAGIGSDSRIGISFLYAGVGYGGSCFPKDVRELIHVGQAGGLPMDIVAAVDRVNERQKQAFAEKIINFYQGSIAGKKFAVWGLAFKPLTDDMRDAPSIQILRALSEQGAALVAYDPQAVEQAGQIFGPSINISYVEDMMEALTGVDALLLLTEWRQFRQPDFAGMKQRMRQPVIFDGRNQYNPKQMKTMGFVYRCIGRPNG
jgi:UDPglucose 6-dehydrogenase